MDELIARLLNGPRGTESLIPSQPVPETLKGIINEVNKDANEHFYWIVIEKLARYETMDFDYLHRPFEGHVASKLFDMKIDQNTAGKILRDLEAEKDKK